MPHSGAWIRLIRTQRARAGETLVAGPRLMGSTAQRNVTATGPFTVRVPMNDAAAQHFCTCAPGAPALLVAARWPDHHIVVTCAVRYAAYSAQASGRVRLLTLLAHQAAKGATRIAATASPGKPTSAIRPALLHPRQLQRVRHRPVGPVARSLPARSTPARSHRQAATSMTVIGLADSAAGVIDGEAPGWLRCHSWSTSCASPPHAAYDARSHSAYRHERNLHNH